MRDVSYVPAWEVDMARVLVPLLVSTMGVMVLAVPVARAWVRYGHSGVVVERGAGGAAVSLSMVAIAAVEALFAAGLLAAGPHAVGVIAPPTPVVAGGVGLSVAGCALVAVAQAQMGASWRIGIERAPTDLVTHGVFRWIRNPIYTGLVALLAGVALIAPSWLSAIPPVAAAVVVAVQARREEAHLAQTHGDAWRQWARHTGRFLPGVGTLP